MFIHISISSEHFYLKQSDISWKKFQYMWIPDSFSEIYPDIEILFHSLCSSCTKILKP